MSVTITPSPFMITFGGLARISAGCAIGCQIGLAFVSVRKLMSRMTDSAVVSGDEVEMGKGFGIRLCWPGNIEMNGAHAGGTAAIDIALLVVDEHAGAGRQAERLGDETIGARVGLEDAGMGGVDDGVEQAEQRQFLGKVGAVEQAEVVGQ